MKWIDKNTRQPTARSADAHGRVLVWHAYNGMMVFTPRDARKNRFVTHWTPTPRDGWVDVQERLPTDNDADNHRCVLALHEIDGIMLAAPDRVRSNRQFTHWMHTRTGGDTP